jgi:hypothetical protein
MLSTIDKARAVVIAAWAYMPNVVSECIKSIALADTGAANGGYILSERRIELNWKLFESLGREGDIPLIDDMGNFNPRSSYVVSRALHTTIHEMSHGVGVYTGLHSDPAWISLSRWMRWPYAQMPASHNRYIETRDGWEKGPSEWIFRADTWFPREYSSKSPFEDFADCMALKALGWEHRFDTGSGKRKLHFLEMRVFGAHRLSREIVDIYDTVINAAKSTRSAVNGVPFDFEDHGRMRYRRWDRRTYMPEKQDLWTLPRNY